MEPDKIAEALRKWAARKGNADLAAVELLAWHEFWLRRADFVKACTRNADGATVISWLAVQKFAESEPRCSTSELSVLRLAVAIGLDDFRVSGFGYQHRRAAAKAFAASMGLEVVIRD